MLRAVNRHASACPMRCRVLSSLARCVVVSSRAFGSKFPPYNSPAVSQRQRTPTPTWRLTTSLCVDPRGSASSGCESSDEESDVEVEKEGAGFGRNVRTLSDDIRRVRLSSPLLRDAERGTIEQALSSTLSAVATNPEEADVKRAVKLLIKGQLSSLSKRRRLRMKR